MPCRMHHKYLLQQIQIDWPLTQKHSQQDEIKVIAYAENGEGIPTIRSRNRVHQKEILSIKGGMCLTENKHVQNHNQ